MKFYISARGVKRLTLAEEDDGGCGGGKVAGFGVKIKEKKGSEAAGGARRLFYRWVLLSVLLMLSLFLPFILVRIAFLTLESAAICSSSLECLAWSFLGGNEAVLLRDELTKALAETTKISSGKNGDGDGKTLHSTLLLPESFKDLVSDVTYNKRDINAFASMAKAMMAKMEHKLQLARRQENTYWHLASHGVPKSLQCLSLVLAEDYVINSMARSHLPSPEFAYRLSDPSFHHVVLFTDNVIAASVVISSTVKSSIDSKKLVFHVITDWKTYTAMHAWFAVNNTDSSAVVEVKGLHQYDWSLEVKIDVQEMLEIHHLIWSNSFLDSKDENFQDQQDQFERNLEFLSPSFVSLLNHLRIYLTELFPDLDKILFLDDDVVVQHDLSSLWQMDLNGKVVGAVVDSWCGYGCCPGRKYKNYFNFTNSIISSSKLHEDQCGWLDGVNIFDLQAWRKTNITKTYHQWLKINMNSNFTLWKPGALPPAILAFESHVHPINSSWHMAGLGQRSLEYFDKSVLENAAVLHFSGPAKPWLEISDLEVRRLWYKHVNSSNRFVYQCGITV